MARVNIEDDAFGDGRYDRLAHECGLADADHARGKMARLWRQCTTEKRHVLDDRDVILVLGDRGPDALIASRLGERTEGGIRIRGTRGRIEWLEKLRKNGRKGGRPRKATRKPDGLASGSLESNPPTPAPTLSLALAPAGSEPGPAAPAVLFAPEPGPPEPDPVADLARHATAEINRVAGRSFDPESKATRKLCRALVRDRVTAEEVTAVVEHKAAEWLGTSIAARVCPATLLAVDNFARYLDEARAGPPKRGPPSGPIGTANHRPTPPRLRPFPDDPL